MKKEKEKIANTIVLFHNTKKENKKTRKHILIQENMHTSTKKHAHVHKKKNPLKKTCSRPRKHPRKRSRKSEKLL